jgi:hypothetical protein
MNCNHADTPFALKNEQVIRVAGNLEKLSKTEEQAVSPLKLTKQAAFGTVK